MSTQRIIYVLLLLIVLIGSKGCRRVQPDAPAEEAFEPPIPDPVSYMAGNLTFDIADLEGKINKAISTTLVPETTFDGKTGQAWHLWVERTGPVRIKYKNRQVYFSAPLQVWYSNPINLRKRDNRKSRPLCALAVNFTSPVSVGPNWRLITHSHFEKYHWTEDPEIRLLGIKIGVKKLAESILDKRRADIERAVDGAVRDGVRLDHQVGKIWRDMQKPLRISKMPENIWLLPKPFSIAAAPVYGNARKITIPIQIAFRVGTRFGPEPVVDTLEHLPRLLHRNELPDSSRLKVLAFIPYTDINQVLARTISSDKLDLIQGNIRVRNITVYGNGRNLIIKTDVEGAVKGTLFFHGQPAYDTLTNTLRIQQVDFDIATKERLFATADWLLHNHLRDTLQAALVVPLRKPIATIPGKIENAFAKAKAGQTANLDIKNFRMVPQRIVVQPKGVQILIKVQSEVAVKVKKLQ